MTTLSYIAFSKALYRGTRNQWNIWMNRTSDDSFIFDFFIVVDITVANSSVRALEHTSFYDILCAVWIFHLAFINRSAMERRVFFLSQCFFLIFPSFFLSFFKLFSLSHSFCKMLNNFIIIFLWVEFPFYFYSLIMWW